MTITSMAWIAPAVRLARLAAAGLLALACLGAAADAGSLHARYGELREQLRHNNFQRAMHIDSTEFGNALAGDVYAVLDHPYATVTQALKEPAGWCNILLLPFNTKHCQTVQGHGGPWLQVRIGRKYDQPLENAYRLDFAWRLAAFGPGYFETRLGARDGPVGTRDYRIVLSAVPLDRGRTFMRLSYSYQYGMVGRMAMLGYLSTAGADKVGFTAIGRDSNGQPLYISGMRGVVERNVMRYYLAIDAHLASLGAPAGQQLEKRLQTWFDATERYRRQLHEMDRDTYVAMKRGEYERLPQAIQ